MPLPKPRDRVGRGLHLARFDLMAPQREDLEQRQGLLRLLVTSDILYDRLGLTILGDDQGLPLHCERAHNLRGMGLEVTDRPDPAGQFHECHLLFRLNLVTLRTV